MCRRHYSNWYKGRPVNSDHSVCVHRACKKGEHNTQKLMPEDVREIRRSKLDRSVLAVQYGVGKGTITHVKQGITWGWLPQRA